MTSELNSYTFSQKGKRMMRYDGYLFHHNKTYTSKRSGSTVVYWECERRRDIGCSTVLTSDVDGKIIKAPSIAHTHVISTGRDEALSVRHDILVESSRRPEAAPSLHSINHACCWYPTDRLLINVYAKKRRTRKTFGLRAMMKMKIQ